jgi:hypothetical protein
MFFQPIAEQTMAFTMKFRGAKSQKRGGLDCWWLPLPPAPCGEFLLKWLRLPNTAEPTRYSLGTPNSERGRRMVVAPQSLMITLQKD